MKLILLLLISQIASVFASDGAFDKKKEASYHFIAIGTVSQVIGVPLIANRPADTTEVKKVGPFKEGDDTSKRTILYTGILTVEKAIKGKVKAGDKRMVTWWVRGDADKKGQTSPLVMCPRVTRSVAQGHRRVIAATAPPVWVQDTLPTFPIVDGNVLEYENPPTSPDDPNDPFSDPPADKTKEAPKK